jgi:hypothetical protein
VRNLKRRVKELEKERGRGVKFSMLILYEGETAPEITDPNVVMMIMHLSCPRPKDGEDESGEIEAT